MSAAAFEVVPGAKRAGRERVYIPAVPATTPAEDLALAKTHPSIVEVTQIGNKWSATPSNPPPESLPPAADTRSLEPTRELNVAELLNIEQLGRMAQSLEHSEKKVTAALQTQPIDAAQTPERHQRRKEILDRWSSIKIVLVSALLTIAGVGGGVAGVNEMRHQHRRDRHEPTAAALEHLREKIVDPHAEKPVPPVIKPETVPYEIDRSGVRLADVLTNVDEASVTPAYIEQLLEAEVSDLYSKHRVDSAHNRKHLHDQLRTRLLQEVLDNQDLPIQRKERLLDVIQVGQKEFRVSYAFLAAKHISSQEVISLLNDAYENNPNHDRSLSQDRMAQRLLGQQELSEDLLRALAHQPGIKIDLIGGLIRQRDAVNARNLALNNAIQRAGANEHSSWTDQLLADALHQIAEGAAEYRRINHLLDDLVPHVAGTEEIPHEHHHEHRHHRHQNDT